METITITSVGYFFDLFIAQRKLEMAITGRENTLQLYEIAKERFKIGTITHDELLQLNLRLINDDLSISDCRVSEQIAMMKLRTYLGYNESITITLSIPPDNHDLILPLNDVMQKAFDNSTVVLDNEINLLYAKQEVAQAKASARFSANISLQFGLNQIGRNLPEAYRSPLDQEIVGLTLSGPILNWGLGKGKVKVAKSQAEVIASQIEQTVNSLQEIITLKVMQFNLQSSQCDVSRLGDEVGRNRYASTRERFVNGTVGVTDLIMAQSEMDAASLRYFQNLSNWWQYYYSIRQITLFDYLEERKIDADFDKLIGERIL
jgi:outer membrane protein TolC